MREIKFRGQTRRYGEKIINVAGDKMPSNWVYGGIFPQNKGGDFAIIYTFDPISKHVVYADTIGQYTGLNDKNGVEIYEGDIVKFTNELDEIYNEEIGVVEYEQLECNFCLHRTTINPANYPVPTTKHTIYLISNIEYAACYEVVGNIYDNPELLEK